MPSATRVRKVRIVAAAARSMITVLGAAVRAVAGSR